MSECRDLIIRSLFTGRNETLRKILELDNKVKGNDKTSKAKRRAKIAKRGLVSILEQNTGRQGMTDPAPDSKCTAYTSEAANPA